MWPGVQEGMGPWNLKAAALIRTAKKMCSYKCSINVGIMAFLQLYHCMSSAIELCRRMERKDPGNREWKLVKVNPGSDIAQMA